MPARTNPVRGRPLSFAASLALHGIVLATGAWTLSSSERAEAPVGLRIALTSPSVAVAERPEDGPVEPEPPEPILAQDDAPPAFPDPVAPDVLDVTLRPRPAAERPPRSETLIVDPSVIHLRVPRRRPLRPSETPAAAPPTPPPTAPLAPVVSAVVRVEGAVPMAGNVPPAWPEEARARGWRGRVVLRLEIGADGRVATAIVESGSGHAVLDQAAVRAVLAWRFHAARRGGVPIPSTVLQAIRFAGADEA